jgi:hypothetical protein
MARWQRLGLIIVYACVFLLLLVTLIGRFSHPQSDAATGATEASWNSQAIGGTFAGVRVREIDPSHAAVILFYDLDNNSGFDYRLDAGPNVAIMSRLDTGGSLSSYTQVNLDSSAFIPAGNRTRIGLNMTRAFNWPLRKDGAGEVQFRQLVSSQVSGLRGFVLFDQAHRYQIELPVSSVTAKTSAPSPDQD